jgi:regulator of protease activity HflC (stomatin/prohibitin superfamily)
MRTLFIALCVLAIVYFCVAKVVNSIAKKEKSDIHIPDSFLFLILPIVALVCNAFLTIVPAQQCGVVITPGGVKQETYNTGWHIIMPWYKVELMEKTAQVYTCARRTTGDGNYKEYKADATQSETVWTPTIDGIKMGFDISASWRIDPDYAWWIYDNVSETDGADKGRFYWLEENVIKPKLKSALALTTSRYTPIQVYSTSREEIQSFVLERMKKDILSYHLVLEQIDIREVYYNSDYEKAINDKKLQEQKALTLVEVTKQKEELRKQAEIDKDIKITQSQGEAEALRIKGQSVASNPKIVELEWIEKWDGKLPTYMLGNGQGIMLNMGGGK